MPLCKCLPLVVIAITLFAQSPHSSPSSSREKISEPNHQQGDIKNHPSGATVPPVPGGAAKPGNTTSAPDKDTTKNQTLKAWWNYLGEGLGPSTWSNWALCLFAAIAAGIALRTLNAIRDQADIAQMSLRHLRRYVVLTARLAKSARNSAEAATDSNTLTRESNETTRQSLELTRREVAIAETQLATAKESAAATKEATELTRQSLVLTQRPRIGVRTLILDEPRYGDRFISSNINEPIFKPSVRVEGTLLMVNIGNSQALILHSYCRVLNSGEPERIPRQFLEEAVGTGGTLLPANTRLAPGQRVRCTFSGTGPSDEQVRQAGSQRFLELNLYVIGWIDYADELNLVRRTTFCRRYDKATDRFLPVTDPDYEHAD